VRISNPEVAIMRLISLLFAPLLLIAACAPVDTVQVGPDGQPSQGVYRISDEDSDRVRSRMLDAVNSMRQSRGAPSLSLDSDLNRAAMRHSRDMSRQSRPWNFGSDGTSPPERAWEAGYRGQVIGENVSETFETELQTLNAWMGERHQREVMTDSNARDMGFGFHQDGDGRLWWTLITGDPSREARVPGRQRTAGF